jgi:cytochrome P450
MHARCPVAWTDTYGGHWVAAGNREVFELARCPYVSNNRDVTGERLGYNGVSIPTPPQNAGVRGGMLEMDEPEHTVYRSILNPYLSPAAVKRWVPLIDEIVRAASTRRSKSGGSTSSTISRTSHPPS